MTDAVLDDARAWQERPLDAIYPVLWLDGLVLKARQGKQVINKSAHIVLGLNLRGEKEVLGVWLAENEGAKFWAGVLSELKTRGVQELHGPKPNLHDDAVQPSERQRQRPQPDTA